MPPDNLADAHTEIAALTAERDALLQRHRAVCKTCAMLDSDPAATLKEFLEKHRIKKP